jgi:hypothetical protein
VTLKQLTIMDSVCGVIDAQFFINEKQYVVYEFAIESDNYTFTVGFKINISYHDMSDEDIKTNKFISDNVNGLPFPFPLPRIGGDPGISENNILEQNDFMPLLYYIYNKIKTDSKDKFGVKNSQLHPFLKKCNIPYVELDMVPPLRLLDSFYDGDWLCGHHMRFSGGSCAGRKTRYIWRWINDCKRYDAKIVHNQNTDDDWEYASTDTD